MIMIINMIIIDIIIQNTYTEANQSEGCAYRVSILIRNVEENTTSYLTTLPIIIIIITIIIKLIIIRTMIMIRITYSCSNKLESFIISRCLIYWLFP